jgi:adenosylmethionine-8-amino-7-oxononanoate aminotransferase
VHQQSGLDAFNREGGMIVARGEGCCVWDVEGREYLRAMARLRCALLGFSEKRPTDTAYREL